MLEILKHNEMKRLRYNYPSNQIVTGNIGDKDRIIIANIRPFDTDEKIYLIATKMAACLKLETLVIELCEEMAKEGLSGSPVKQKAEEFIRRLNLIS